MDTAIYTFVHNMVVIVTSSLAFLVPNTDQYVVVVLI